MDRLFTKRSATHFKPVGLKGDEEIVVKASGIQGPYHLRVQTIPIKKGILNHADKETLKLNVPQLLVAEKDTVAELNQPQEITLICNLDLAFVSIENGKAVKTLADVLGRDKKSEVIVRIPFEVVAKLTGKKRKHVEEKQNLFVYVEESRAWMSLEALALQTGDIATVKGAKSFKRKGAFQFRVKNWPSNDRLISACC